MIILDHYILSLHRLSRTPITEHIDILQNGTDWKNDSNYGQILYPWGKTYDDKVGNEDEMWNDFITNEYPSNVSMINKLYYPLDTTSYITKPDANRDEKDNLRAWCMSTSGSLTADFMVKQNFSKLNHINPDNDENQVGIIGYNTNNRNVVKTPGSNTEFFDMEKETNAYKYPVYMNHGI